MKCYARLSRILWAIILSLFNWMLKFQETSSKCAFLHIGKNQESVDHFFVDFLAFPGFWGVEFWAFQESAES